MKSTRGAGALVCFLATACGGGRTMPVAPSAATDTGQRVLATVATSAASPTVVTWSCLTTSGCGASSGSPGAHGVVAPAPNAPTNLAASVSGSTVTLTWTAPASGESVSSYVVEAGSTSSATNLANFDTGRSAASLVATDVPVGTYYVRVRASNLTGRGAPSNEIVLTVGSTPCTPAAPSNLVSSISGSSVTFTWTAPGGTCVPTAYEIDAGSTSGASNLAALATGSTQTAYSATGVPNGTYYVRVRARNGVNLSPVSNEVVVTIGSITSTSLTGRWVGVAPDGLVIDAETGSCDIEEDLQMDLTQTGSVVTGTMLERIRKVNPAALTCGDKVGDVLGPWQVSGTAGTGTLTLTVTVERGETSTYTGTFTDKRIVIPLSRLGATVGSMTLNRQ